MADLRLKLGRWTKAPVSPRWLVVLGLGLLANVVVFLLLTLPAIHNKSMAEAEVETSLAELRNMQSQYTKAAYSNDEAAALLRVLPSSSADSEVAQLMQRIAEEAGVTVGGMERQAPEEGEQPEGSSAGAASSVFVLRTAGSISSLLAFIHSLQIEQRLIEVSTVSVMPLQPSDYASYPGLVDHLQTGQKKYALQLTVTAYWLPQ